MQDCAYLKTVAEVATTTTFELNIQIISSHIKQTSLKSQVEERCWNDWNLSSSLQNISSEWVSILTIRFIVIRVKSLNLLTKEKLVFSRKSLKEANSKHHLRRLGATQLHWIIMISSRVHFYTFPFSIKLNTCFLYIENYEKNSTNHQQSKKFTAILYLFEMA